MMFFCQGCSDSILFRAVCLLWFNKVGKGRSKRPNGGAYPNGWRLAVVPSRTAAAGKGPTSGPGRGTGAQCATRPLHVLTEFWSRAVGTSRPSFIQVGKGQLKGPNGGARPNGCRLSVVLIGGSHVRPWARNRRPNVRRGQNRASRNPAPGPCLGPTAAAPTLGASRSGRLHRLVFLIGPYPLC